MTGDEITEALDALEAAERDLLDRLLEGSPIGRTRDALPDAPPDRPVQRLLAAGLLRRLDADTVILPRLVGQVLRGESPGPTNWPVRTRRCRPRPRPTSTRWRPAQRSTFCAKSSRRSKPSARHRLPSCAAAGSGCGRSSG